LSRFFEVECRVVFNGIRDEDGLTRKASQPSGFTEPGHTTRRSLATGQVPRISDDVSEVRGSTAEVWIAERLFGSLATTRFGRALTTRRTLWRMSLYRKLVDIQTD
jgi:hypothetical protein